MYGEVCKVVLSADFKNWRDSNNKLCFSVWQLPWLVAGAQSYTMLLSRPTLFSVIHYSQWRHYGWCHPLLLVIVLWNWWPFLAIASSPLPPSPPSNVVVCPVFFVNSTTKKLTFIRVSPPKWCQPGRSAPHPSSDATDYSSTVGPSLVVDNCCNTSNANKRERGGVNFCQFYAEVIHGWAHSFSPMLLPHQLMCHNVVPQSISITTLL